MSEKDSGVLDGVAPCGHRNPPSAHFCDVCGVKLPMQCPCCHAINRRQANFCSNCGIALRDERQTYATPSSGPLGPSPDSAPATESDSASVPRKPFVPAHKAATEGFDLPVSFDPFPWTAESAKKLVSDKDEDAERLKQIDRFKQRRRRRRRMWVWLVTVSVGVASGFLAEDLIRTHILTPNSEPPPLSDIAAHGPVATRNGSATIAQGTPTSMDPRDTTVQSDHHEGSPAPAAPEKSPAVVPAHPAVGGELKFVVPGEPPSYDAHREETFALIHPAAPHYNTLLRIDPLDPTGTRVVGDLATSWTVSPDKRTYVLRLRRGVKFHDGSQMTSRDVRATYEKIINPPPGITSARKGEYLQIETVQAPEPYVVAFKLKWPSPSFIHSLASPWNWIYKADILERDVRWYEKNIMGTGPFIFVEHIKGSRWVGRRNPEYWDRGKPYLDGYRALFIRDDTAQASAVSSGHAYIQFRGFSPVHRDDIVRALGENVTVQESPWNCLLLVAINHEREPFHDRRVRRALSLALDRYRAAGAMSKTAIVGEVAGVQVPRSPFATPPAELMKLAGYWRDIRESRSEGRRLLAEAGVPDGFSFVLKNRDIPMPYQLIGTWLVDEWRQIGLTVRHEIQDSGQYFKDLRAGNFDLSTDFQCGYVVDPDLDLYKFQSRGRSDANYGRYTDPVLDDLYVRQSRMVDPEQRRRYIRAFEKRLLDEEAHYIYTLQWHRIVPHSSRVRGWTITPSHYLNNQLDTVWLTTP
jgi:peptide/nickel transport system substrate-binding protein